MEQAAELGVMGEGVSEFLHDPAGLNLPTPKQATEAEAEVFATRYTASD